MPNRSRGAPRLAAFLCAGLAFAVAGALAADPRTDRRPAGRAAKPTVPARPPPMRRAPCPLPSRRSSPDPACRRRASPSRCVRSGAARRRRCSRFAPSSCCRSPRPPRSSPRSPRSTCSVPSTAGRAAPTRPRRSARAGCAATWSSRGGPVGLTGNELRRWFLQLREEGLQAISGNIVLDGVALLHERDPKQVQATAAERALDLPPDARSYNHGKLVVSVRPPRASAPRSACSRGRPTC